MPDPRPVSEFPWVNDSGSAAPPIQPATPQLPFSPVRTGNEEFPWLQPEVAQMAPTPVDTMQSSRNFFSDFGKAISGYAGYGALETNKAIETSNMLLKGEVDNFKNIRAKYSEASMAQYKANNVDPYGDILPFHIMKDWLGPTIETLPYITRLLTDPITLSGAGVGAGAGAGVGLLAGAFTPAEILTVPGGAMTGLKLGGTAGFAMSSAKLGMGDMYFQLREAGISHDIAQPYSVAAGAAIGLIQSFQGTLTAGVTKAVFKKQLESEASKKLIGSFLGQYLKTVGIQAGAAELQNITQLSTQALAAYVDGNDKAYPTAQQIVQGLVESPIQAAKVGATLGAAGLGTSKTLGMFTQKVGIPEALKQYKERMMTPLEIERAGGEPFAEKTVQTEVKAEVLKTGIEKNVEAEKPLSRSKYRISKEDVLHGSSSKIKLEEGFYDEARNLYGPGFYTTDNLTVAEGYSQKGKGTEPTIYKVKWKGKNPPNLIDIDAPIDPKVKKILQGLIPYNDYLPEDLDMPLKKIYSEMKDNLASDGLTKGDVWEYQDQLVAAFQEAGYDGFTHIGGGQFKIKGQIINHEPHKVRIFFDPFKDLKIVELQIENEVGIKLSKTQEREQAVTELKEQKAEVDKQIENLQDRLIGLKERIKKLRAEKKEVPSELKTRQANLEENLRSAKEAEEALSKNLELIEQVAIKEARNRLEALIRKTAPKSAGKGKKSIVDDPKVQAILDTYRQFIKDPKAAEDAILNAINQELEDAAKVDKMLKEGKLAIPPVKLITGFDKAAIAEQVLNFKDLSANQIEYIANGIETLLKTGKSARLERRANEAIKLKAEREQVKEGAQGTKPATESDLISNALQMAKQFKRTFGDWVMPWNIQMGALFQHVKTIADFKSLMAITDVTEHVTTEKNLLKATVEKAVEFMVGDNPKRMQELLSKMSRGNKVEKQGEYINAEGNPIQLIASKNQVIGLWMRMKDLTLKKGLTEGNKFTFDKDVVPGETSTERLVEQLMTSDDKRLAQGLLDFYRWFFPIIDKHNIQETGLPLKQNANFSGPVKRKNVPSFIGSQTDMLGSINDRRSMTPGSTIERTNNAYAVELTNPFTDAWRHTYEMVHWLAWSDKERQLRFIFGDNFKGGVREIIELKYGKGFLAKIDDAYQTMAGTRKFQASLRFEYLDTIRANLATGLIGLKWLQAPKQWTGILSYLSEIEPHELIEGMQHGLTHPKEVQKVLNESKFYKDRADNIYIELVDASKNEGFDTYVKTGIKSFKNLAMVPSTIIGDRPVIIAGGYAVYRAVLIKTGSHEQALAAFDRVSNQTQSSALPDQMTAIDRMGSFGRMMTLFARQNIQMIGIEANQLRRALSNPTRENVYAFAKTWIAFHTAQALFESVASSKDFFFGDEDDRNKASARVLRNFLIGSIGGAPLMIGDVITAVVQNEADKTISWVTGGDVKNKRWEPKYLPYESGDNLIKLMLEVRKLTEGEIDIDTEEVFKILKYASKAVPLIPNPLGGVPTAPIIKSAEDLILKEQKGSYSPQ